MSLSHAFKVTRLDVGERSKCKEGITVVIERGMSLWNARTGKQQWQERLQIDPETKKIGLSFLHSI
jgi:hypothetical protein